MLTLKVTDDLNKLISGLKGFTDKELLAITIKTLNGSARDAKYAIDKELLNVVDRPTPFTQRAVIVINAKPNRLFAQVGYLDYGGKGTAPSDYLMPLVTGGPRKQKRSEKQLSIILPDGNKTFLTPAKGAKLNKYGNIPASKYVEILSYFKAFNLTDTRMNRTKESTTKKQIANKFFMAIPGVARTSHLSPGIYERTKGGLGFKKILHFARQPMYKPKFFDFYRIGIEYANASFIKNFNYQVQKVFDSIMNKAA